jgi:periplasmic divalent cation tolerance protein
MPPAEIAVVLTSVGSEENASVIGRTLVDLKLAACVSILSPVRSMYIWKGSLCDDREWLLLVKTRRALFPDVRSKILELHTYELPEVLCIPVSDGHEAYLDWLLASTRSPET